MMIVIVERFLEPDIDDILDIEEKTSENNLTRGGVKVL